MKLRNKKTREIKDLGNIIQDMMDKHIVPTLISIETEWEDYKPDKERWYINENGGVLRYMPDDPEGEDLVYNKYQEEIGNYFETKKEAERAVEKLKALANLRKRGLKFNGWDSADRGLVGEFEIYCDAVDLDGIEQELDLVFGKEEI